MLRNVASKCPRSLPSILVRSLAVEVVRRAYSSNSPGGLGSSWVPPQSRRRGVSSTSRRPLVINGKPVALHVNDLRPAAPSHVEPSAPCAPTKRQYDSDLIVVLDMDECLIHSQFLSTPAAAQVYAHQLVQQRRQQARTNSTTASPPRVESFRVTLPDGDLVHVNLRPGLDDFLQQVTDQFETHIFTAAMPVYANPVLDRLDPDGTRFAHRWFRDSCTYDPPPRGSGAYVKNLARLPVTADQLARVVLVDNNPLSFLANPHNGILVNSFYDDPTDQSLPAVADLIQEVAEYDDVRPILGPRFALEESLQDVGRSNLNQVAKAA